MIIGSGPNRIGQGIEFDYCCVHAVQTFRALGYEAVMINCNPETVSTDYDTSDRLYFEPLSPEEVLAVLDREQPEGVVTQFGGQTPLRLARHIEAAGYSDHGHAARRDRPRRGPGAVRRPRRRARHPLPARGPRSRGPTQALAAAAEIGYPVLVRPSYVLGGRAMRVCYDDVQLRQAMSAVSGSVLVDRFVENAVEIDVDALCDGEDVFIAAVMQHVEEAGVHSGDSSCVLPAQSLTLANALEVEHIVKRLAPALGVVGLLNIQLAIADSTVYVLEANPRASRTVPFASKAIGINLVEAACKLAAGQKLRDLALPTPRPLQVSVKAAVLPFARFPGADPVLGPEMRSTGEVMASASDLPTAFAKAERAAGRPLPASGTAFISVNDTDKPSVVPIAAALAGLGFELVATDGTARTLRAAGLEVGEVAKVADAETDEQTVVDLDPGRPLRPDRQHAAGLRGPRRRLPDPRGRARRPGAVHHHDLGRGGGRPRDRERARRDGALAPGADRDRRVTGAALRDRGAALRVTGTEPIGPYTLLRVAAGPIEPGAPGPVLHAPPAGTRAAAPDVALPRRGRRALLPDRPDRARHADALQPRRPGSACTSSARSETASTSRCRGRCSSAAASAWRRSRTSSQVLGAPPAILGFRSAHHAEAAALVPGAEVVIEPTLRHRAPSRRPGRRARLRPGADARGRPPPRAAGPARLGGADGVRLRRVLRLRRRGRRPPAAAVRRRARPAGGVTVALVNASGCLDALTAPDVAADARRVRDEDDHARAARGQPAGPDRRDRVRHAQLDRPPGPGHRRRCSRDTLPALARAGAAGLGLRRRLLGRRLRRDLRAPRRAGRRRA